ncbi:MAG TPA: ABC transporter permease [Fibrobacteria bacterium]|nr:ABC transporter permease [Fibrobacteria bacterium]
MPDLALIGRVCLRTWTKTARRPVVLVFGFLQPLMWMGFFGFLFQRYAIADAAAGFRYLDYLVPGICVMTLLFGSSQAGTGLIRDLQTGFAQRMLLSPAAPASMFLGKLAADVARLLLQALVVGAVGFLLGARFHVRPGPLMVACAWMVLFAGAYASLSCLIALATRSQETMGVFIQVVNMPILFTSSILVPRRQMPAWLAGAAEWNPVSAVVDALRYALSQYGHPPPLWGLVPAACAGAVLAALGAARMAAIRRD